VRMFFYTGFQGPIDEDKAPKDNVPL
jgi:hypothetical protein